MEYIRTTIKMPFDLYKRLKTFAIDEHKTFNAFMLELLEDAIKERIK